jgi:hypothetical protein
MGAIKKVSGEEGRMVPDLLPGLRLAVRMNGEYRMSVGQQFAALRIDGDEVRPPAVTR